MAGSAVCEGGLMIDLSLMKDIQLDLQAGTAKAPFMPQKYHHKPILILCYLGNVEEGKRV